MGALPFLFGYQKEATPTIIGGRLPEQDVYKDLRQFCGQFCGSSAAGNQHSSIRSLGLLVKS